MKKADYTKVEQQLEEGLRKIKVRKLLRYADVSAAMGGSAAKELSVAQRQEIIKAFLKNLQVEVTDLKKKDASVFEKLEIDTAELKKYFENPSQLTGEDWEKVKTIRQKVAQYKKNLRKQLGNPNDEEIIEKQRKKQKIRRFNINEKWVPLH